MTKEQETIFVLVFKQDVEGRYGLVSFDEANLWFLDYWDSLENVQDRLSRIAISQDTIDLSEGYCALINKIIKGEAI